MDNFFNTVRETKGKISLSLSINNPFKKGESIVVVVVVVAFISDKWFTVI